MSGQTARRDENSVPVLLAVSSTDGVSIVEVWADPVTHRLLVQSIGGGGGGNVFEAPISGTIDDSNTTFVFSIVPQVLVINGLAYRQAGGAITWTPSGDTVILSSPVGINGSIFGIAGSVTLIETIGTINDSNTSFTSYVEPIYLVMNGSAYMRTGSLMTWTYLNGSISTSFPVGVNGCLFGMSGISLTVDSNGFITGAN